MTIFSLYFPIVLSLSLSLLLATLINLFKKNIHHLLRLTTIFDIEKLHLNSHNISPFACGLGITTLTKNSERHLNVPESKIVNPSPTTTIPSKYNDGLISCTESLGSESSGETRVDNGIGETNNVGDDCDCRRMRTAESKGRWRRDNCGKNEVNSFPPPLSSLNRSGQPSFFLRPVRKNGRLELTEVRIHRPELLHASRENGRFRLHLVSDGSFLDDVEGEEKKEGEEIKYKKELNLGMRCHEMVNHHHRHHHHRMQICGVSIV